MNITVLGCGRWGSCLAWYFNKIGYNVLLWGRSTSERLTELENTRQNDYIKLPVEIILTRSLSDAFAFSDNIIIAIREQNLRTFMADIICENYLEKTFILCMKGLENATYKRLSEVVYEFVGKNAKIAILVGPGQPSDLIKEIPTCMLIDSVDYKLKKRLVKLFRSNLIHFKIGNDLIGNEIGAAANKIIGIAGGILDNLGYTSLKGVLMVVGVKEISNIIKVMGGDPNSAYGLGCLGDFQASLFSEFSNSVAYGRSIVSKEAFIRHAPGAFTASAVVSLAKKYNVSIPLLSQISSVISNIDEPMKIVKVLLDWEE